MYNYSEIDNTIITNLNEIASKYSNWSFKGNDRREYTHSYFQYPAMMVPQMQNELLKSVLSAAATINIVFDPFVGSGTVLTEAMTHGLDFVGQDINPLAILLCRTKSESLNLPEIKAAFSELQTQLQNDKKENVDIDFPNLEKWFEGNIAQALSKIRRAIVKLDELRVRRFFWVALAETVRLSSNSRTSNFKLYVRTTDDIASRDIEPISMFINIVTQNLLQLNSYIELLKQNKHIEKYKYKGVVTIEVADSRKEIQETIKADLLITSPPYGDNKTTVSYGQYSYLPLQWIELKDIDDSLDSSYLKTTQEIDSRSLGGSLKGLATMTSELSLVSPSFEKIIRDLRNEPVDRAQRVAAFCRDLNETLDPILSRLKPNSLMIWTVGNRHVGGREVPTDKILQELLESRGVYLVEKLQREFPAHSKRMEHLSDTMSTEKVLMMRKGNK